MSHETILEFISMSCASTCGVHWMQAQEVEGNKVAALLRSRLRILVAGNLVAIAGPCKYVTDRHSCMTCSMRSAGGDGTIAWVLGVIKSVGECLQADSRLARCLLSCFTHPILVTTPSGLRPAPPVAIMPLGTGNDLARSFGWGHAFMNRWIQDHAGVFCTLQRVGTALLLLPPRVTPVINWL
jgi:hypothetical protein